MKLSPSDGACAPRSLSTLPRSQLWRQPRDAAEAARTTGLQRQWLEWNIGSNHARPHAGYATGTATTNRVGGWLKRLWPAREYQDRPAAFGSCLPLFFSRLDQAGDLGGNPIMRYSLASLKIPWPGRNDVRKENNMPERKSSISAPARSRPRDKPPAGKIIVKAISHCGGEVLKICEVD